MDVVEGGVYFLYDKTELVYIGQSDNLYRRIGQHIAEKSKIFDRFEIYPTTDRMRLEGFLIDMFKPKYNLTGGKDWRFGNGRKDDLFPNLSIQEAINKYDDYIGDPTVSEIADEIGTYRQALLRGLANAGAPIYKMNNDHFRLDKKWYDEHKNKIWDYVE